MFNLKLFFVFFITQCFIFCGLSQDLKTSIYVKYSFKVYSSKPTEQTKKLQDEFKSKQGVFFSVISEKGESFVVAEPKLKFRDISEVARIVDCKLEKISEVQINNSELEELHKVFKTSK